MNRRQPLRYIRSKSNSLFLRLVAGFLCIILILAALTTYTLSVSKSNVREEIVKYNTLMLRNTMANYEKHFDMIKKQMSLFYFSERVQQLQSEPRYSDFPEVIKDIVYWVSNPNLFIHNIVFYSKSGQFAVEKGTSAKPDVMFGAFLASDRYPLSFWDAQFEQTYNNRVFPAESFYSNIFQNRREAVGELIPIVFKRADNDEFYMVVLLDAKKMYTAFHQAINDDFAIYNGAGETIYRSGTSDSILSLGALKEHKGNEFIHDDKYHFYKTADNSGMTYMQRVPESQLAYQTRLKFTLVAVIAGVILFVIVISLLFAARINNPFKKLIASIRGSGDAGDYRSNIQEFDLISSQLRDKNKLQKQWAFIHRLKDIRNENDSDKLDFAGKPFVFVLIQVVEKKNAPSSNGTFQRWLYYMKVFIEERLNQSFPDALTFQIEYNRILSLVFIDRMEELHRMLEDMKAIFDQDRDSGTITIAVTSIFDHSEQINEAYKEVLERIEERRLVDETQIVADSPGGTIAFGFSPEQDTQFRANLREGHTEALSQLFDRFLDQWRSADVTAAAWLRFAEWITERIRHTVSAGLLSPARLEEILANAEERIGQCVTAEELERLLRDWVKQTAEAIHAKKEPKDNIVTFVMDYVKDNLAEEIYLDALAEKLNISSGYLSTYFKEKTGTNLVEFVNETRVNKAASLLLHDSRLKIQEVAEAVGYRNITSFNRMFKKYTGLKPSEYRNSGHSAP
ncbi:helix-turn-helix domain-containing protein [Cohnella sp. GCM10027633]|uniref:helix-turn-helix domain-containing protein n=1 Tax=unclassified Cohnella TaxID=2636738 RepID=UPI003643A565